MYRPNVPSDRRELLYVGCAGWSLPRAEQPRFPPEGTHLQRYSARLPAVEINSSFYRPHRPSTYARWADAVPEGFRFSVKLPRAITHTARLVGAEGPLDDFLAEVSSLGPKLGCLLVQLPPSLSFTTTTAAVFIHTLRERHVGPIACECGPASSHSSAVARPHAPEAGRSAAGSHLSIVPCP